MMRNGKIPMPTGIYHAAIHNCTIGNEVLINHIGNYIADYRIGDNVLIENTGCIDMSGVSAFGNGVEVSVLNETGGREVPIYDCLSAHVAYLIAMYRHNKDLVSHLRGLVNDYVETRRSATGTIESDVTILNTGSIRDVYVGPFASVDGATRLNNGSIMSEQSDPVHIGPNVMADDFIICAGAKVDSGAVLVHTFVGQATSLTRLFSAHDSLFFANCACENGEAAAIFAGPYTVTMHKSSLLIAGMFSFLNAGSGSNQSNHMYKLGPIHQGSGGPRVENHFGQLYPLAGTYRSVLAGDGPTREPFRHIPSPILLPYRESRRIASCAGSEPEECGNHPRRHEMAQARQAPHPQKARLHKLQSSQPLHSVEDD